MKTSIYDKLKPYKFHIRHFAVFILWFIMSGFMNRNLVLSLILGIQWLLLPLIVAIITFVHIIRSFFKKNIKTILIALTLIPLTVIYVLFGVGIVFYKPDPYMFFQMNRYEMMEVVELVKDGEIEIVEGGTILPFKYRRLSNDKAVVIRYSEKNGYEVKFFIYRGLAIGYSSSLIYSEVTDIEESEFHNHVDSFEKLIPNWYFSESR